MKPTTTIKRRIGAACCALLLLALCASCGADGGRTELAVRIGYWNEDSASRVEQTVEEIREKWDLTETPPWTVAYYPAEGKAGLLEFIMDGTQEQVPEPEPEDAGEEAGQSTEETAEESTEESAGPNGTESEKNG